MCEFLALCCAKGACVSLHRRRVGNQTAIQRYRLVHCHVRTRDMLAFMYAVASMHTQKYSFLELVVRIGKLPKYV